MSDSGPGRPSKVKRLLEEYVNHQILRTSMENAGMEVLEGEVENTYRLLTADDTSSGERTRMERRLERHGIDVDSLRDDFVSYQAVRTYLKEHRNAEYTRETADQVRRDHQTIQQLVTRTETIATHKLDHLRKTARIDLGDFRVSATAPRSLSITIVLLLKWHRENEVLNTCFAKQPV